MKVLRARVLRVRVYGTVDEETRVYDTVDDETRVYETGVCDAGRDEIKLSLSNTLVFYIVIIVPQYHYLSSEGLTGVC